MNKIRVGIIVFNDVEVLDFSGPFEVFSVTRLDEVSRYQKNSPFEVLLIAEHEGSILTTGGMKVSANYSFPTCPKLDILIVPGGLGTRKEFENIAMIDWIKKQANQVQTVASVCTGSMLLAQAGLLSGLQATTHWRSLDLMQQSFPDVEVDHTKHYIRQDNTYTSAGISAGLDMSLIILRDYLGEDVARATAKHMEYPFPENDERRIEK